MGLFSDNYPEICEYLSQTPIELLNNPDNPYKDKLDIIVRNMPEFDAYKKVTQSCNFFFAAFSQTGEGKDANGKPVPVTCDEDVKSFILERVRNWQDPKNKDYEFAVIAENKIVGYTELFDRQIIDKKVQYEWGIFIDPACQGQSYGKEVMVSSIQFAFEKAGADQIYITTDPNNTKSRNNIEKHLGAEFIGEEPSKYTHLVGGGTHRRKYLVHPKNFYAANNNQISIAIQQPSANKHLRPV